MKTKFIIIIFLLFTLLLQEVSAKRPMTFDDVMKFKSVRGQKISNDGKWILYNSVPDRGDGEVVIHYVADTNKYTISRGSAAEFSEDSRFAAMRLLPKSIEVANAKTPADAPKSGLTLINLITGRINEVENVKTFKFTNDANWLIYQKNENKDDKSDKLKKKKIGSTLVFRHLNSGTEIPVDYVTEYLIDSNSNYVFYTVSSINGKRDGIYVRKISDPFAPEANIHSDETKTFSSIAWSSKHKLLAYLSGTMRKEGDAEISDIYTFDYNNPTEKEMLLKSENIDKKYYIPAINNLQWTDDGKKLFFGYKYVTEKDTIQKDDLKFNDTTFFNIDSITYNADEQIWHWKDDKIGTHQKKWWNNNKNRTFAGIIDYEYKKAILLANDSINNIIYSDNSKYTIGYNEDKYSKLILYDGWYYDLYSINLETGEKKLIIEKIAEPASLSPLGSFIVYFKDKHWHLYNNEKSSDFNLTQKLPQVNFYDDENDLPRQPDSYGIMGWQKDEKYVYINNKYDIFKFFAKDQGSFINFTATDGIKYKIRFRYFNNDPNKKYFNERDTIFLNGYFENKRVNNLFFFETHIAGGVNLCKGDTSLETPNKYFNFRDISKNKKILYSRESFDEFSDLWVGNIFFDTVKKITNINPQMKDYIWGTTEPMAWKSLLGDSIKGYLIKPDNYDSKKKYPLLIYYYERFSEETYRFYQPRNNHRPVYQVYLGSGYLVFVPDIHYRAGRPGQDAYDCIIPGIDLLSDKGIIDKDRVVIQGHSWGGYQTAWLAASTNRFIAAAAGAPVGNMTSAYSQIRTESGLARQFQYERYQSRIGGNLWDSLNNYMNSSPVFQLQKGGSPLLILHGNVDEAVPFAQGVELFLAYKRLHKPCVLIEYNNEPHIPRKYENRLDWQIKMKEWFDYYVFDKKEPEWIKSGKPYLGK